MPKRKETKTEDRLLTVKQVAETLGFSVTTIYEGRCGTHTLKRIKFHTKGKKRPSYRFSYLEVTTWLVTQKLRSEEPKPPRRVTAGDRVVDMFKYKKEKLKNG